MRAYPSFWYLKVVDDRNHCLSVHWLSPLGFKLSSRRGLVGHFPTWQKMSGSINQRALPVLRCPPCCTIPCSTMTSCRRATGQTCYSTPWTSCFTFKTKCHSGIDEKIIVAYEIISFTVLCCTEHQGWVEKSHMPDTMLLVNLNDTRHLECLAWTVYNGALHVGNCPELLGEHQWCTMFAGIFQHIYKGHDETAHCPP